MEQITALYARQSVEREDSLSVEGQLARCRAEAQGHTYRTYIDRGYSGKNTNRPAFLEMMGDVRAGVIRRVIVYRLDRISRSILDFAQMMEVFEQQQVEFLSSTEHFDTSLPMGRAMLSICIVFAQLERETIQSRVTDSYADRSTRGFYMGGRVPYGFALVRAQQGGSQTACYTPVPQEAAVVRRIFEDFAVPECTLAALAQTLNEEGIQNRSGKPWRSARLSELLKNPVYCKADHGIYDFFSAQGALPADAREAYTGQRGCYLFRGESGNKRITLTGAKLVLAPHTGLIPGDIWVACRRKLLTSRGIPKAGKASWLSGRVRCAKCGYALGVVRSKSAAGRYFICTGKAAGSCDGLSTIYADALEQAITAPLLAYLCSFCKPDTQTMAALQAEAAACTEQLEAITDRAIQATGTLFDLLSRRAEQVSYELENLHRRLSQTATADVTAARWNALPLPDKQRVAAALIDGVTVDNKTLEITWRV